MKSVFALFILIGTSTAFAQLPYVATKHQGHLFHGGNANVAQPLDLPTPPGNSPTPVCAATPSVNQLKAFGYFASSDLDAAASLSLSFGMFAGSGDFKKSSQVVVFRTGQSFECPSTDGKYTVIYGTEFDSGVLIDQDSIAGKANFATVAANVTINNSNTEFSYSSAGFQDDMPMRTAGGKVAADMSANGLSVQTFKDFNTDFTSAIASASAGKSIDPPLVIGWRPIATDDVTKALAQVFALGYIAEGKGCLEAIRDYPIKSANVDPQIRSTYKALSSGAADCDASDKNMQSMAKQLLGGQRISLP
jgi:hypothetical protein